MVFMVFIADQPSSWRFRFLVACRGSLRFIELLPDPGANFLQLGMQPPDLSIQFDKAMAVRRDQFVRLHAGIVLVAARSNIDAGRGLLGRWITLQVQEIQT
jgi:hypothetical protein